MAAVKARLPKFLEHPARPAIVWSLTAAAALFLAKPACEAMRDACSRRTLLERKLVDSHRDASGLTQLTTKAEERETQLTELEERGIAEDGVHAFREQLVELLRTSGCRLRQIDLGDAQTRPWATVDDPLKSQRVIAKKEQTEFSLRTQPLSLSATGPLSGVQTFCERLKALERTLHTKSVTVRLNDVDRDELLLEVELLLFHLDRVSDPAAA